jgi:hypothetical protein
MIDSFLKRYAGCQDPRKRLELRKWTDQRLTPLEWAELRARQPTLPDELVTWVARFQKLPPPRRTQPQGYRAREITAGISAYSSGSGRPRDKALLLAFAGGDLGLLMPTHWFLQYLDSDRFDVLILQDFTRAQFALGVRPYSTSLSGLLAGLDQDLGYCAYDALFCCGFSMGGPAALRAGALTGARRAVSFGGRMRWNIDRLLTRPAAAMPAFDPLCACMRKTCTDFVCVYCADNTIDRDHAEKVAQIVPARRLAVPDSDSHNSVYELAKAGRLQGFLDAMFDIPGGQSEMEFLADNFERVGAPSAGR